MLVYAPYKYSNERICEEATQILTSLGVPVYAGWYYLRESIEWYFVNVNDPTNFKMLELYAGIARIHAIKPHQVERCMRQAVERTFLLGNMETVQAVFGSMGCTSGKVTNKEFISRICDAITQKLSKEGRENEIENVS